MNKSVVAALTIALFAADSLVSAQVTVDLLGDPLPKHARARMGNVRFHHRGDAAKALYTPDGKSLVSVDRNSVVHVWDAATGQSVREIVDLSVHVRDIALSPDGTLVATAEHPSRIRLWDIATGQERRRFHGNNEQFDHLAFSPDGHSLAAGVMRFHMKTRNETWISLWDLAARTEHQRRFPGDWLFLYDIRISPDSKTLATASNDAESNVVGAKPEKGSTRVWDLAKGQEVVRFPVDGFHVRSVAFSPDGRLMAAGVTDQTIRVYDLTTGRERLPRLGQDHALQPMPPQQGAAPAAIGNRDPQVATCMAFSPDGSVLASGCCGTGNTGSTEMTDVYVWDVAHAKELRHFPAHQAWVQSLSFSPDGKTLATTGPEPTIRLWDVATGRESSPRPGHRGWIRTLAISPVDGTVFTSGQDGSIRRWDPATGRELGTFATFDAPIDALAFSPDGETLLLGGSFGGLAVWSVSERRQIHRLPRIEERNPIRHVAFAPDGKTVASERRIWDVASGKVLVTFKDPDDKNNRNANFFRIFYSPDSKQIITAELNGARIWDIASGKEVRWALRSPQFHFPAVALSPDGRFLARGGLVGRGEEPDAAIHVIELASGQGVATLKGHKSGTYGLAFSPDGRFLASGSGSYNSARDTTIRIWEVASGHELRRFEGHTAMVNAVAFTPDGRSVVSGSADATALVWDVSDLIDQPKGGEPLSPDTRDTLWADLAGDDARAAYRATWALGVPSAVAFLGERLGAAASPDAEGIPAADGPIAPPEALRTLRAMAALERVGTPEARAILERLSRGNAEALETRDAQSALGRLNAHKARPALRRN